MALFSLSRNQVRTSLIINDHVIRYIDAKHPGSPITIRSLGERYLPFGVIKEGKMIERDTLLIILEECVEVWKLKGRHVLFCVPDSYVVIRTVQVPIHLKEKDEIKGHLLFEIGESIHLPFDDPIFDVHIIGERDGQRDVLLFASPEKVIKEYTELFDEVKLKPVVADLSSLAIYRLYYYLDLASRADHLLSIQFDIKTVNITIFHQFKPVFTRHFDLIVDEDFWQIARNYEGEETLVWNGEDDHIAVQLTETISEVERVINFYNFSLNKGKQQITKLLITGDHPYCQQFITMCESTFDVPVESLKEHLFMTSSGKEVPSRYYEALGLALKKEVP